MLSTSGSHSENNLMTKDILIMEPKVHLSTYDNVSNLRALYVKYTRKTQTSSHILFFSLCNYLSSRFSSSDGQ